ncbi:MAG: SUMF1/EgtB/PvdO family nonheme iron enzyme [Chloroflexota bacterium]
MTKIFISYRRDDAQWVTDIVYDKMTNHFGKDNVFLDVGSIPFGVDFREYLNEQVAAHDVVLVIIGTDWARIMQERANQQNDFVRIEIESALRQDKLVIPILVKNASMPNFANLPDSISDLQWRNSARIRRQPDLDSDCNHLAESIRWFIDSTKPKKPTSKDLMPDPFDWIEIPASSGTMNTNEGNVVLSIPTESYWISKYPITNAQFAKFIKADGYSNENWWTEQGWKYNQRGKRKVPRHWNDSKWNSDAQPIVGVNWYESVAFCLWLSDVTSENIMLPTEAQWQYAAQGDDGRNFPWGNDWNRWKCQNSTDTIARKTSLVTQYEGKGDSPLGVVDMVGNIWEWCLTDYRSKDNCINSSTDSRVLRGGSWFSHSIDSFRCVYRNGNNPTVWGNYFGFRIVCSK